MYNKGTAIGITVPDYKLYYRGIVIKNSLVLPSKQTGGPMQLLKILKLIHTSMNTYFISYKEANTVQWKNESIFNKQFWHNWMSTLKRMQITIPMNKTQVQMGQKLQHKSSYTEPHRKESRK